MRERNFTIRSYGCQELARLYNPHVTGAWAWRILRHWIERNEELRMALLHAGWRKGDKMFTPKMVELIVEYLGEP